MCYLFFIFIFYFFIATPEGQLSPTVSTVQSIFGWGETVGDQDKEDKGQGSEVTAKVETGPTATVGGVTAKPLSTPTSATTAAKPTSLSVKTPAPQQTGVGLFLG
jgi:hypothetical protein